MLQSYDEDAVVVTEEVFENERVQPFRGWGHSWPGHFLPSDRVGHWSDRMVRRGMHTYACVCVCLEVTRHVCVCMCVCVCMHVCEQGGIHVGGLAHVGGGGRLMMGRHH
jgi:hypothetical protein